MTTTRCRGIDSEEEALRIVKWEHLNGDRTESAAGHDDSTRASQLDRQLLRCKCLAVMNLINDEREDLTRADLDNFSSIIREVERLHELVQKPREQVAAAEGRFLRLGKSRSDPPSTSSSPRMSQTPRICWRPCDIQDLIYLLLDEYNERRFVDGKPLDYKMWDKIAQNLDILNYPRVSGYQVVTKVNSLKMDYRAFQFLKEQTGVKWNEEKDTVEADDDWWKKMAEVNPSITKFKNKGLANYPELHLLFAKSTASGAVRHSSFQMAPMVEEAAWRESAVRCRHGAVHNVDEEYIASGGGVNLNSGGVSSMDTVSGSRKRGSSSATSAQQRCNAKPTSEDVYYDEVREYITSKRLRDDAVSSGQAGGMKECIGALQNMNPRLLPEQFYVVVRHLTGNRDAQEAFLAMTDEIKGEWARCCK